MTTALKFIALVVLVLAVFSFIAGNVSDVDIDFSTISSPRASTARAPSPSAEQEAVAEGNSIHSPHIFLRRAQAREDDQDEEYVEIELSRDAPGPVNVTEWTIVGEAKDVAFKIGTVRNIPQYDNDKSMRNALLRPGDTVYVGTSISPARDSFQTSMCTGYLAQHRTFYPNLKRQCPPAYTEAELNAIGIDIEEIEDDIEEGRDVTGERICYRFLKSMGSCKDPVGTPDKDTIYGRCEDFIKSIGYEKCVDDYRSDPEFFTDRWYIYLGVKFDDVWDDNSDTISLYDAQGALVTEISY